MGSSQSERREFSSNDTDRANEAVAWVGGPREQVQKRADRLGSEERSDWEKRSEGGGDVARETNT